MAFIWLDSEGNGVVVQETIREIRDRVETARAEDEQFVEVLRDTEVEEDEEPYRPMFVDRDSVYAIEHGKGVGAVH